MTRPTLARVGCICLLAAVGLAGGCGNGGKATVMRDAADFNSTIGNSDKPVLMMFFKQGCASCAALEPTIDQLAGEYQGRAEVAKLMVMLFTLVPPSEEVHQIKDRYDVVFVPVVILFVHGQQVKRFDSDYDINHYRQALNEALGAPAPNPKSPPAKT
jgi:thioredoxin 1